MASAKSHFLFVRIFDISLVYHAVYMEAGAVLTLGSLDTYLDFRNLVAPDEEVSVIHIVMVTLLRK